LFGVCFRSSLLDIASCKAQARITDTERKREIEYRVRSLVVFVFLFRKVVWCFQALELLFGVDSGFCGVVCWVGLVVVGVVVVLLEFFYVTEMDGK
jgi:hypothetical protein